MSTPKSIGRTIGLLFLMQLLLAPPVYTSFGMMGPVTSRSFLTDAAGSALQIRVALLLVFVLSALTLAVALVAMPLFGRYSERMALLFLALCAVGLATQAVETVAVRQMLALSVEYARPGAPRELLETLGPVVRSGWHSSHYVNLTLGHLKALVFFIILYRFAFVPRPLSGAGVAATILSTTAATIPLLGYRFSYLMILPAALTQLGLIIWLLVKGFQEGKPPLRADTAYASPARA